MSSTPLEREIKLRFDSPERARAAVVGCGAVPFRPRRLQSDVLFDTDQRLLSARGQVLRVRIEAGHSYVTFKSPAEHPTLKLREELETGVGDGDRLVAILQRAGFRIWFRYEKYREEFSLGDVLIAVDETPVGTFVEIEGSDHGIVETVGALGRGPADYIIDSYRTLFVRHCREQGVPIGDMVFSAG
jgi:adenylate cyclase, class 2